MLHQWWSSLSFLLTISSLLPLALAGTATADDTDAGMFYSGLWVPDGDPNTFGHHDTWTNQSGASVTFDFIGTEIQVFATRRPSGTYLTNVSFSIDGNLVYTSPSLSPSQHHITITNFGEIFWLDFVQFTTADFIPSSGGGAGGSVVVSSSTSTSTTSTQVSSTSSSPQTTSSPRSTTAQSQLTGSAASSSSSESSSTTATSTSLMTTSSGASTGSGFLSVDGAPLSTAASGPSSTDGSAGTAFAAPANASSGSSSRTPTIIGIVVGVVGMIALLLAALWWFRMRSRQSKQAVPEMSFATAPELGMAVSHSSKDRSESDLPQTPQSGVPLLGGDSHNTFSPPNQTTTSEADALRHLEKLRQEENSSARVSGPSSSLSSSGPGARRPLPSAPGSRSSGASAFINDPTDGFRSSFANSTASGSHATSGAPLGPSVRTVRYSRDAGIRLAGGPLGETEPPVDFDEVETLPPSYAQIHGP
ncbi:hypothetical protein C8T65DRAFT_745723 [Cerioporus squamosus]|nr:hypothetical protein C8T65DRAFT_745723 [Cerioporus squamosus]